MTGGGGCKCPAPLLLGSARSGVQPTPLSRAPQWVPLITTLVMEVPGSLSHPPWLPAFPAPQINYVHSDSCLRVSPN